MNDDNQGRLPHPTTDQPLNAKPRGNFRPAMAVLGLIALIALIFFVLTVLRYET